MVCLLVFRGGVPEVMTFWGSTYSHVSKIKAQGVNGWSSFKNVAEAVSIQLAQMHHLLSAHEGRCFTIGSDRSIRNLLSKHKNLAPEVSQLFIHVQQSSLPDGVEQESLIASFVTMPFAMNSCN